MNVLEIIENLIRNPNANVDIWGFAFAIGTSSLVGVLISALYQAFYENRATGAQVHRSFLLMAPSITALFIAIQFSLPLSLGLLAALSVIRFRTPIKEPEEIVNNEIMAGFPDVMAFAQQGNLFGGFGGNESIQINIQTADMEASRRTALTGMQLLNARFAADGGRVQPNPDPNVVLPELQIVPNDERINESGWNRQQAAENSAPCGGRPSLSRNPVNAHNSQLSDLR